MCSYECLLNINKAKRTKRKAKDSHYGRINQPVVQGRSLNVSQSCISEMLLKQIIVYVHIHTYTHNTKSFIKSRYVHTHTYIRNIKLLVFGPSLQGQKIIWIAFFSMSFLAPVQWQIGTVIVSCLNVYLLNSCMNMHTYIQLYIHIHHCMYHSLT